MSKQLTNIEGVIVLYEPEEPNDSPAYLNLEIREFKNVMLTGRRLAKMCEVFVARHGAEELLKYLPKGASDD